MSNDSVTVDEVVDARDLACPMPLLKAKQGLASLSAGQCRRVQATDPGSVRDFHAFINMTSNQMVLFNEDGGIYTYIIRKGSTP